jgi:hypothetical protein
MSKRPDYTNTSSLKPVEQFIKDNNDILSNSQFAATVRSFFWLY